MHDVIYEQLKALARQGRDTTYSELAPLANLDMGNQADRNKISDILGEIAVFENEHKRPLLPVIVVYQNNNLPGPGFFTLARELGLYQGKDDVRFFTDEMRKVYDYWKQA